MVVTSTVSSFVRLLVCVLYFMLIGQQGYSMPLVPILVAEGLHTKLQYVSPLHFRSVKAAEKVK